MSEFRYWSVEDCCWVGLPAREVVEAVDVPTQREDEPLPVLQTES